MSPSLHPALRNLIVSQVTAFAGPAAKLRLYTAALVLLSEHICGTPFAPDPINGILTRNPIANGVAVAAGDAAVARLYRSDGSTLVMGPLTVGDNASAAHIKLAQAGTFLALGQTVIIDTGTVSAGNV